MNIKTIEDLKKSAIEFQNWIDSGFEELDETDTYPSDLFYAVATPKNILELIEELDSLKARIDGGIRMYAFNACGIEAVQAFEYDETVHKPNATLILDDGVKL